MNILLTAIGSMSAEAVIRSLRKLPNCRLVGTNTTPKAWVHAAQLVDSFVEVPPATTSEYLASIESICCKENIDFLIPLTDPEVDALTDARDALAKAGTLLAAPQRTTVSIARDKLRLYDRFRDDPVVRVIPTFDADKLELVGARFPLLAKPRGGRSSEGISRIADRDALDYHVKQLRSKRYVIQPWLSGHVCVVDVVRQAGTGNTAAMARTELLRTSNGAGLTVRMESDQIVLAAARRVAGELDLNGCLNVEFIQTTEGPLLMDVNPRFSAGVAFSQLAGYDMVINHLRCFTNEKLDADVEPAPAIFCRRYVEDVSP